MTKPKLVKEYNRNVSDIGYKTILKVSLKDNVKLQCPLVFQNGLTFWYKNGVRIMENHLNNKELEIKNTKNKDFGKYKCAIHTDYGE